MARVEIPVEEIMKKYSEYLNEIGAKCASYAVNEIKKNAKKFEKHGDSANMKAKWWNNTGVLKRSIKRKKGKYNKNQFIAGAMSPLAHVLEYGHAKWLWGKETGEHVPASPFVRPAEESLKNELPNIIRDILSNKGITVGR